MPAQKGGVFQEATDEEVDAKQVVNEMIRSMRYRRTVKHEAVQQSHGQRIKKCRDKINSVFTQHEKEVIQKQRVQVERLVDLLQRKAEIEARMIYSTKTIERAYYERSQEVRLILRERAKDLR